MMKYLMGFLLNFFNRGVSIFARIDNVSKVSKKAKVLRGAQIFNSTLGDYSYVGVRSNLIFADVGKYCSIGANSICGMGIHTLNYLSTSPIFTEKNNVLGYSWSSDSTLYPFKKVIIGNDVWIGTRVMIMGGVKIGDGAVIGAGAIVTKDVPPYAIVAGIPAKTIRYRFSSEVIDKLLKLKWWDLEEDKLKESIQLFQTDDINLNILECLNKHKIISL